MDLSSIREQYLKELKKVKSFNALPLSDFVGSFCTLPNAGLYGIIVSVSAQGNSAQGASRRTVHLTDPSLLSSKNQLCSFRITNYDGHISIGDILKVDAVKLSPEARHDEKYGNPHVRVDASTSPIYQLMSESIISFPTFTVDFNNLHRDGRQNPLRILHDDIDLRLFFLLEAMYAIKLLHWSDLRGATSPFLPKEIESKKNMKTSGYTNLIGMVVKRSILARTVVLTMWDGSPSYFSVEDPCMKNSQYLRSSGRNQFYTSSLEKYYVSVNIWNNDRPPNSPQYAVATQLDINSNDIVILFNVEKTIDSCGSASSSHSPSVSFTLRSGLHQGKAVRVAKFNSVIGRLFISMLKERCVDISHSIESSHLIKYTPLELPCLRLEHSQPEIVLSSSFVLKFHPQFSSQIDQAAMRKRKRDTFTLTCSTIRHVDAVDMVEAVSKSSCVMSKDASRITFPLVHAAVSVDTMVSSNLPPFMPFESLIRSDRRYLESCVSVLANYRVIEPDFHVFGPRLSLEALREIFKLALILKSILDLEVV